MTAKGGNYLLNVGPDARGLIPAPSVERLQAVGRWLDTNAEAIKNTTMWTTWEEGETIRYTQGVDGQVYAIALEWPGEDLVLKNIRPAQGTSIELLGYADPIQWDYEEHTGLTVQLPTREEVTVKYAWVFRIREGTPVAAID